MYPQNTNNWWEWCSPETVEQSKRIWITIGNLGYSGAKKQQRIATLNQLFGEDGWKMSHIVRGRIVSFREAIWEYEQSYRVYLQRHPEIVEFLVRCCGNVYDYSIQNVYDNHYLQPESERNHYQDISIRRIISEMIADPQWHGVRATEEEIVSLINLSDGQSHELPRASGFRGQHLLEVRGPESPGFFLNPAVIPVYDPSLIAVHPIADEWYLRDGCGHLSVEAFWQSCKVIQVRYDGFIALGSKRGNPLELIRSGVDS